MRRGPAVLVGLMLLAGVAAAGGARAEGEMEVSRWKYARRISAGDPGWTTVELDGPVWAGSRPDLADLRLLDEAKREIPWIEMPQAPQVLERFPVQLLDVFVDAGAGRTTFVADLGGPGRVTNRIVVRTTSHDFFKKLTFEAASDLKTWQGLGGSDYIYDMSAKGGGSRLDVSYPDTSYRYLRVTIADMGTPPLANLGAELQRYRPPEQREKAIPSRVEAQGLERSDSWTVIDLGYRGIPINRIQVSTPAALFQRPVSVEGSDDRTAWRPVARAGIYRYGVDQDRLNIPVSSPSYRFYKLTIANGSDVPVVPESVSIFGIPRQVQFKRPGNQQIFLLYGNPGAPAPRYDPAQFREAGAASPAAATLGRQLTVITEPEEIEAPKDLPKSDADPRLWRFERRLDVGAVPRFVTLPLDAQVLDTARPDLADLRLVDEDGVDIPFQVRTDRSGPATAWPITVVNKAAESGQTWWVLDLGARNSPTQFLRMATAARNLSRVVQVEGSNDGSLWRPVGKGECRRVETIFGVEESLVLSYPEARYRYLRVTVPDGRGGAGAELEPAEVRGFPPSIQFRADPSQQPRLFYGNPAAVAKSFPPGFFVDAYAPTQLRADALGLEVDHSPPPERPAFLKPGTGAEVKNPANPWVAYGLWGLVGVLVVGLGFALVRVFRDLVAREQRRDD